MTQSHRHTEARQRHALLIANSQYHDHRLRKLRAPTDEARHLQDLLVNPEIGNFESAQPIVNWRKADIEEQIESLFVARKPDDLVLLYISAHGVRNDDGELFIAASNTDLNRLRSTAIAATFLHQLLDDCQAGAKLLLVDCCFSGGVTRGRTWKRAVAEPPPSQQLAGQGTYVITASDEFEEAAEEENTYLGRSAWRSVFTSAVLRGLESGEADINRDGVITGDELYAFVSHELEGQQTPVRQDKVSGDLPIAWTRLAAMGVRPGGEPSRITLGDVLPPPDPDEQRPPRPGIAAAVGRSAEPLGKSGVVQLDLTGQCGHLAVVGQLNSGKSTFLQTLVIGLSLTHTPEEARFYCVDPGGQLNGLERLPHVRGVIDPTEAQPLRGMIESLRGLLQNRRQLFRQHGLNSAAAFRARRGQPDFPAGDHADVFVIVDGWDEATGAEPELAAAIQEIAGRGLHFGVHVLVSARDWHEIPAKLEQLLVGRVELRLSDPTESRIDRKAAATLSYLGAGLYNGERFVIAVPEVDADSGYELDQIMAEEADPTEPAHAEHWLLEQTTESLPDRRPWRDNPSLLELLGLPRNLIAFDVQRAWRKRPVNERYRVPFGLDGSGARVELDLKEAALGGMGPHGLCIGATGSGKSEFLRTLTLGLMATHSSTDLNFVLVDFKGGAGFAGFERAPHVSAVITNLADEVLLVGRMQDALQGELVRRQELLRSAGNFASRGDYEKARDAGAPLEPLPVLFIVIDEFSELLAAKPELIDLFVMIGRVGRSLGVHLLLASQRLEEGRLRGLDSHLSYRIGLRTFSAAESRSVLGVPDAYELPREPGHGFLKHGSEDMIQFKAAYVSRAHSGDHTRSERDVVIDAMAGQGTPAHRVWLPPLAQPETLDDLLPPLTVTEARGLAPADHSENNPAGFLRAPVGIVDLPYEQRRDLLWADFSGGAGHGVIVGGPQTGKSTLVRTIILAMALTHTPDEVQFYGMDLGGGSLGALADLPHVGTIAARREPAALRRMVAELTELVRLREHNFAELGAETISEFRDRKRRGDITPDQDPLGDVFLVVDGWGTLRFEFEDLAEEITRLAATGLAYGVHVLVTAQQWSNLRRPLRDLLGTQFELRLGDPTDSSIDRRAAANVPTGQPGRGLTRDKHHFLAALPRIDSAAETATIQDGVTAAVRAIADAWRGRTTPAVRLLPEHLSVDELDARVETEPALPEGMRIPIGIDEARLAPVYLDFDVEPHFLAFADSGSGKTSLLRRIVRGIAERSTAREAVLILADYRRSLLGVVDGDQLLGYAMSAGQLDEMIKEAAAALDHRRPGPDVTAQQLRSRSWWTGPELFVVVDDYDLVATRQNNPLTPLVEYLPLARDVGLHLVVARRTGGSARALVDPVLGKLRELATGGLVMNGSRDEGNLIGNVRPGPMPPGRGTLVTRREGARLIQVAFEPEE